MKDSKKMFWDPTFAEGSDIDVPDFFEIPHPWKHAKNLGLTSEEVTTSISCSFFFRQEFHMVSQCPSFCHNAQLGTTSGSLSIFLSLMSYMCPIFFVLSYSLHFVCVFKIQAIIQ